MNPKDRQVMRTAKRLVQRHRNRFRAGLKDWDHKWGWEQIVARESTRQAVRRVHIG